MNRNDIIRMAREAGIDAFIKVGADELEHFAVLVSKHDFADAYRGAMDELYIWKRRALEAEELNRKFMAEINGATFMGEPAQQAQPTDTERAYLIGFADGKQAQAEAVPAEQSKWAAYVAGVIGCYLKEPDDSAKVKAIAGIIERRMWASAHQPLKIAAWRGVHVEGDYLYYDEFPEDLTAEQRRQLHLKPLYEGAAPQQAEAVPTVCNHTYVLDHGSSIEVCQHCGAPKRSTPKDNWQQYAKESENAQQCIERHRKEQDALLELLRQAKQQAEAVSIDATKIIDAAVSKFLGWRLPFDFAPDAGISYDRSYRDKWGLPIGTNLFTAQQAKYMFECCLRDALSGVAAAPQPKGGE